MTGVAGHCPQCGTPRSGGRWCAQCGSPQAGSPTGRAASRAAPVALIVVTILILGVVSFVGARWWLSRDDGGVTPAPVAAEPPPSSTGEAARPAKKPAVPGATGPSSSPATLSTPTASPTAAPTTVITTATVTAAAAPAPAADPTTTGTVPGVETIAGVPRHDIGCDRTYIVVLGSALDRAAFAGTATALGAAYPGAKFLDTGSSCLNFRSLSALVLYEGPYGTAGDACAARFAGTRDAYVKVADPAVTERTVSCLCPPAGPLPDLGPGDQDPYVTEAQYALQRLGFYAGDGTGTFDGATQDAVRSFQSGKGLPVDGRLSATTWPQLAAADCAA